jgi:hypothetical protein
MAKRTSRSKTLAKQAKKRARDIEKRREERGLKKTLKQAKKAGLYYGETTGELSSRQKSKARALQRQYGVLLDPERTIVVPMKRDLPALRSAADKDGYERTERAIFVPRDGGVKKASLKYNRKHRDFAIETVREREGPSGVRVEVKRTPLTDGPSSLDYQRKRIKREAKRLGPIGPKERLVYRVTYYDEGGYGQILVNFDGDEGGDALFGELERRYRKMATKERAELYSQIAVEKISVREHDREMADARARKQLAESRRRRRNRNERMRRGRGK